MLSTRFVAGRLWHGAGGVAKRALGVTPSASANDAFQQPQPAAQQQQRRIARGLNRVELMGWANRVDTQVSKESGQSFVVMNVAVPGEAYTDQSTGQLAQAATQWIPCISFKPTHVRMAEEGALKDGQRVLLLDAKLITYNKQRADGGWDNKFTVRFDRLNIMSAANEDADVGGNA